MKQKSPNSRKPMHGNYLPSGKWIGCWVNYPSYGMMDLNLSFEDGFIKGRGNDWVGNFLLYGEYDSRSGDVKFWKKYLGKHFVSFQGQSNGHQGIWGRWEMPLFRLRGPFSLWPGVLNPKKPFGTGGLRGGIQRQKKAPRANRTHYSPHATTNARQTPNRKGVSIRNNNSPTDRDAPHQRDSINLPPYEKHKFPQLVQNSRGARSMEFKGIHAPFGMSLLRKHSQLQELFVENCQGLWDLTGIEALSELRRLEFVLCENLTELSGIDTLPYLTKFRFSDCPQIQQIPKLGHLPDLREVSISSRKLGNLSFLEELKFLKIVDLRKCSSLQDISPISKLENLNTLNLGFCRKLWDLRPLRGHRELKSLSIQATGEKDLSCLQGMKHLSSLNLHFCDIPSLKGLGGAVNLKELSLPKNADVYMLNWDVTQFPRLRELEAVSLQEELQDISCLSQFTELRTLRLDISDECDLAPLGTLGNLEELELCSCGRIGRFNQWDNLAKLRKLRLRFTGGTLELRALRNLKMLECLQIDFFGSIFGFDVLMEFPRLRELVLTDSGALEDLSHLGNLPALRKMVMGNCPRQKDLSFLRGLKNLEFLSIGSWFELKDISALGKLQNLQQVTLGDCPNLSPKSIDQIKAELSDCRIDLIRTHCSDFPAEEDG